MSEGPLLQSRRRTGDGRPPIRESATDGRRKAPYCIFSDDSVRLPEKPPIATLRTIPSDFRKSPLLHLYGRFRPTSGKAPYCTLADDLFRKGPPLHLISDSVLNPSLLPDEPPITLRQGSVLIPL